MVHQASKNSIRLLSWNLWFDQFLQLERLNAVLSQIVRLHPDIIAFQELTFNSENFFDDKSLPFSDIYHKIPRNVVDKSRYWEGIYTRFEFNSRFMRIPFQDSEMGRGLTVVHFSEFDLVVGCMHLESEDNHDKRRDQLRQALTHFSYFRTRNKILTGDTNVRGEEDIDDLLPDAWSDVWEQLMTNDPGYTADSERNSLRQGGRRDRLDRVYCSCHDFKPQRVQLVGTEPLLHTDGSSFFPSDHFGLLVDFVAVGKKA
ncbi:endonuclease/exonuclease/phosphatase family protein [candidate division KSB1 bacterium]|nr:endonuclease/exonuclease/phosphatase family protein [candidate division KSB1 bacterium]